MKRREEGFVFSAFSAWYGTGSFSNGERAREDKQRVDCGDFESLRQEWKAQDAQNRLREDDSTSGGEG
jgi:hypothetical protein